MDAVGELMEGTSLIFDGGLYQGPSLTLHLVEYEGFVGDVFGVLRDQICTT